MASESKTAEDQVPAELARLFAGREPSQAALARCAWLEDWDLLVRTSIDGNRRIVISGCRKSDRFTVHDVDVASIPVLWIDRRRRFALTVRGMMNLGDRVQEITERGLLSDDK